MVQKFLKHPVMRQLLVCWWKKCNHSDIVKEQYGIELMYQDFQRNGLGKHWPSNLPVNHDVAMSHNAGRPSEKR